MPWEYKIGAPSDLAGKVGMEGWLNRLGNEGWELVTVIQSSGHWIFKRQIRAVMGS